MKSRPAPEAPGNTYQLKIELEGISPPIWRRLQVPGAATLGWLHAATQLAMGWTNSHLHQFIVCDRIFSDPIFEMNEFEDDPPVFDEHEALLMEVAPNMRSVFMYHYDFGDSWEHIIKVELILPRKPPRWNVAKCLGGARACPPEDCGGAYGYLDMLAIIADSEHDEHESTMKWLGGKFNPEAFDIGATNKYLRKLKWPNMSIEDLGEVLIKRHSAR